MKFNPLITTISVVGFSLSLASYVSAFAVTLFPTNESVAINNPPFGTSESFGGGGWVLL